MKCIIAIVLLFLNASFLQAQWERGPFPQKKSELTQVRTHSLMNGVQEAWVRHYASGQAPTRFRASDVAIDDNDNIYVTGWVSNTPYGYDYFTAKYSPEGHLLWMALYNGEANRDDQAEALCLDGEGNVIVTGNSHSFSNRQAVTVKYSPEGIEQWAEGGSVRARDITTDPSNNIVVVGSSNRHFAITKYDPTGEAMWSREVAAHDYGSALAVVVDEQGQIYATGTVRDDYQHNFLTVKYSASGEEQWAVGHDPKADGDYYPGALAVDPNSNVVVSGRAPANSGLDYDYLTVKYDSLGNELWHQRYRGPERRETVSNHLAVDLSGNIYVTGESSEPEKSDPDFVTIKYSPSGEELWVARYDGAGNTIDRATRLQLDNQGNVVVTGNSSTPEGTHSFLTTIKYAPHGSEKWVRQYGDGKKGHSARALALDSKSNVIVTGVRGAPNQHQDLLVAQYDSSGTEEWVQAYRHEQNSDDRSEAIAFDDAGNVYIAATSTVVGSSRDILILKYTPTGEVDWQARYNGPTGRRDEAIDLAVDGAGNAYVAGESYGNNDFPDILTLKYNPAGELLWAVRSGPPQGYHSARALTLDGEGNVYVTGSKEDDFVTLAYNATGEQKWVQRFITPDHQVSFPEAIDVDHAGNIFVTGSASDSTTSFDITTIKYDQSGRESWVRRYDGGTEFSYDRGRAQIIDLTGHLYVTGVADGQIVTIKYTSSGKQDWVSTYGSVDSYEQPQAIAVDGKGRVYVLGMIWQPRSLFTIQYDRAGQENWIVGHEGLGYPSIDSSPLQVDGFGNLYVTGTVPGPSASIDFGTLKYNSDGQLQWRALYNRPENTYEQVQEIAVDGWGNVYVTGTSANSQAGGIVTTLKYTQTERINQPRDFNLSQNYPNPFNGSTIIRYRLENLSDVRLTIYNMRGQEVETLVNSAQIAGGHEVSWNPQNVATGTYLYRLQVKTLNPSGRNYSQVGKLVFLK